MLNIDEIKNTIICNDCLEVMKQLPDKCVDLVLTDPPYGLTWSPTTLFGKETPQTKALSDLQSWDKKPTFQVFEEIIRVSKNQIIWGGNYFCDYLGAFKRPLIWNKLTGNNNYADGELAWTSLGGTMRIFTHQWCGAFKDSERGVRNVHPTQKPRELMLWCIRQLKDVKLVLDPFFGSGTTGVACESLGINYIGIEISPEYCRIAEKRIQQEKDKLALFNGLEAS